MLKTNASSAIERERNRGGEGKRGTASKLKGRGIERGGDRQRVPLRELLKCFINCSFIHKHIQTDFVSGEHTHTDRVYGACACVCMHYAIRQQHKVSTGIGSGNNNMTDKQAQKRAINLNVHSEKFQRKTERGQEKKKESKKKIYMIKKI